MFDDHIKPAAYLSLALFSSGVVGVAARIHAGAALPANPTELKIDVAPVGGTAMVQSNTGFFAAPPRAPVDPKGDVRIIHRIG